jgi:hypothetical protein
MPTPPFSRDLRVDPNPTKWLYSLRQGGSSSVVECFLAKEDVAGSTPVSRSKHSSTAIHSRRFRTGASCQAAGQRRGTQVVRERSAKPLCVGSIPTRASNIFNHMHATQGAQHWLPVAVLWLPLGMIVELAEKDWKLCATVKRATVEMILTNAISTTASLTDHRSAHRFTRHLRKTGNRYANR